MRVKGKAPDPPPPAPEPELVLEPSAGLVKARSKACGDNLEAARCNLIDEWRRRLARLKRVNRGEWDAIEADLRDLHERTAAVEARALTIMDRVAQLEQLLRDHGQARSDLARTKAELAAAAATSEDHSALERLSDIDRLRLADTLRFLPGKIEGMEKDAGALRDAIEAARGDVDLDELAKQLYADALPDEDNRYVRDPQIKALYEAGHLKI